MRTSVYDFYHMKTSVLSNLPSALQELLPQKLWQDCTFTPGIKGECLFRQGSKTARMYYVCSGEVVLQRLGIQGEYPVLQRARQSFVAEASLQSARYHCDAMVTVSGVLVVIPIKLVKHALLVDPAFSLRWMGMLSRELKRLRAQCERLSLKRVSDRLLHLIKSEGREGKLPLEPGLKSIALELGVSHEALYRSIATMEKRGILCREAGKITIL